MKGPELLFTKAFVSTGPLIELGDYWQNKKLTAAKSVGQVNFLQNC